MMLLFGIDATAQHRQEQALQDGHDAVKTRTLVERGPWVEPLFPPWQYKYPFSQRASGVSRQQGLRGAPNRGH